MPDLSYFNIGFRSESISDSLNRFKQGDKDEQHWIEEAQSIISDCLRIDKKDFTISSLSGNIGYEITRLLPLVWELFPHKNSKEVSGELKTVLETILKIDNNENEIEPVDIDKAISFFSKLSSLCLSHSTASSMDRPHNQSIV